MSVSVAETTRVLSEGVRERAPLTLRQFGIFAQGTHAHHVLEFDHKPGVTAQQAVSAFRELRTPGVSAGGMNLVLAFGSVLWHAVTPDRSRHDRMLARMFGNEPDGVRYRLTDYSRPVSGSYYFAPSLNALNELIGKD
jgi:hypothetical protein